MLSVPPPGKPYPKKSARCKSSTHTKKKLERCGNPIHHSAKVYLWAHLSTLVMTWWPIGGHVKIQKKNSVQGQLRSRCQRHQAEVWESWCKEFWEHISIVQVGYRNGLFIGRSPRIIFGYLMGSWWNMNGRFMEQIRSIKCPDEFFQWKWQLEYDYRKFKMSYLVFPIARQWTDHWNWSTHWRLEEVDIPAGRCVQRPVRGGTGWHEINHFTPLIFKIFQSKVMLKHVFNMFFHQIGAHQKTSVLKKHGLSKRWTSSMGIQPHVTASFRISPWWIDFRPGLVVTW